ncbi:MAG: alpha/beta hydrolase [Acidimicrobiia bacterium]|nr:alpha/beta hydrolase [Acidimicrobiia bacterium]
MTAPTWFTRSIAAPASDRTTTVEECDIHWLDWAGPSPDAPGLVFVHGGAAHAHWFSFVAPMFTHQWHVAALDLSGHGDSGHRDRYDYQTWAAEIVAVSEAAGFPGPPVIVGHSMGGTVTTALAAHHPAAVAGAIIVDALVSRPDAESEAASRGRTFRAPGVYDTFDEALGHFRLIPPQPASNPFILDHIARHSLHETDRGWTWKFDPHVFDRARVLLGADQVRSVTTRVALLRGEHSVVVPPDVAEYLYGLLGRVAPVVTVPESHHHVFVDQPLAFITAIRALLQDWDHSSPRRPPT